MLIRASTAGPAGSNLIEGGAVGHQVLHIHTCCPAGDDLIGPRDIKKGLHMLTNASIDELEEPSDDDGEGESGDGEHTRFSSPGERKRHKRRTSRDTDLLSKEQMNQVGASPQSLGRRGFHSTRQWCHIDDLWLHCASGSRQRLSVAMCTPVVPSRHTDLLSKEDVNQLGCSLCATLTRQGCH